MSGLIGPLAPGGLATGLIEGLIGKKKSAPKKKPRVMPTADDEAIKMAKKRSIARQKSRGGRVSTILSGGGYGG